MVDEAVESSREDEEAAAKLQAEVIAFQEECAKDLAAAEPIIQVWLSACFRGGGRCVRDWCMWAREVEQCKVGADGCPVAWLPWFLPC